MSDTLIIIKASIQKIQETIESLTNELENLKKTVETLEQKKEIKNEQKTDPIIPSLDDCLNQTNLKQSSKQIYKKFWQKIAAKIFNTPHPNLRDFVEKAAEICKYIIDHEKQPANKIRMICTPLKQTELNHDHYLDTLKTLKHTMFELPKEKKSRSIVPNQITNISDEKKWTWVKVIDYYEQLRNKPKKTHYEWTALLSLAIAIELAPQRANEIVRLEWSDTMDNNCIVLDKKIMIIRINKSNRGPITFELNDKFISIMNEYKQFLKTKKFNSKYVFVNYKGQKYNETGGGFQKCLKRLMNLTLHDLRHIYISDVLIHLDPEQRNEKARQMFHEVCTQIISYSNLESDK